MNKNVVIVAPCYNENITCIKFLEQLESYISLLPYNFVVVIANDCSSDNTIELLSDFRFKSQNITLRILELDFNVGHQKAIYQGLLYAKTIEADKFIVLDSDGEDDPKAIKELLEIKESANVDIVHVARLKRKEALSFRLFYMMYKLLFSFLTGKNLNFGNYCLFNRKTLNIILHHSFIHFAAFLSKQRLKSKTIFYDRQKRLDGQSKMKFSNLIHHAFKSFVEYAEDSLLIFLKLSVVLFILFSLTIFYILYVKIRLLYNL